MVKASWIHAISSRVPIDNCCSNITGLNAVTRFPFSLRGDGKYTLTGGIAKPNKIKILFLRKKGE